MFASSSAPVAPASFRVHVAYFGYDKGDYPTLQRAVEVAKATGGEIWIACAETGASVATYSDIWGLRIKPHFSHLGFKD
jgi:hypothetical protein